MFLEMLKGKIHRARLTGCDVNYEGSLEIDLNYLEAVGILPYERILVVNATNGNRLETYAIPGERGKKTFLLNGAAAHLGSPGDIVTIMCFAQFSQEEAAKVLPNIIILDDNNDIVAHRKGPNHIF